MDLEALAISIAALATFTSQSIMASTVHMVSLAVDHGAKKLLMRTDDLQTGMELWKQINEPPTNILSLDNVFH